MPIHVAIPKEIAEGENRVALVPSVAEKFVRQEVRVFMENGAGERSFFNDQDFDDVAFVGNAGELYQQAGLILKVQPPTMEEIDLLPEGAILACMMQAYKHPQRVEALRARGVTSLAMELVPRISRAQSMDVLSSQASVAGYKAVLLAANLCSQFFPMLTTAAGTIRPAKVLIIGAGVAGLQAVATARRLGAMVEAYDVRSATKEQVESLGAKFLEVVVDAESEGGYARELTEAEKRKERDMLANHVAAANAVITTAHIPGKAAPQLIPQDIVERMRPGSVIIDIAAESGGNCALTQPGETVDHNGVLIYGPLNVPSMLPVHASEMYAKNLYNLAALLMKDGALAPDWDDEILAGCTLTRDGDILHEPTRKLVEGANA